MILQFVTQQCWNYYNHSDLPGEVIVFMYLKIKRKPKSKQWIWFTIHHWYLCHPCRLDWMNQCLNKILSFWNYKKQNKRWIKLALQSWISSRSAYWYTNQQFSTWIGIGTRNMYVQNKESWLNVGPCST